jgi:hypothetical protein
MKNFFSSKSTIVVIVIVVILAAIYFYYNGSSAPSSSTGLVASQSDQTIGTAELSLLGQVESLKVDPSLFQDPAYTGLQDYTRDVPSEPVGRPNPFEPYPGEVLAAPAAGAASPAAH